jgi:hypothetical protein
MRLPLMIYLYKAQGQVMPQLACSIRLENVSVQILVMKKRKSWTI